MMLGQPIDPVVDAAQWTCECDLHRQSNSRFSWRHLRPREERDVRSGMALAVGIKQVVSPRRILVDAALDEAHTEYARIEIDIVLGGASDAGYVMKSGYACHSVPARKLLNCYVA